MCITDTIKGNDKMLERPVHHQIWCAMCNQTITDACAACDNQEGYAMWRELTVKRFDQADRDSRKAGGRGFLDC